MKNRMSHIAGAVATVAIISACSDGVTQSSTSEVSSAAAGGAASAAGAGVDGAGGGTTSSGPATGAGGSCVLGSSEIGNCTLAP